MRKFAALVFMSALLVGCTEATQEPAGIPAPIPDNTEVDLRADGTVEVTTDHGTMTTDKEMPEDWPTDVPPYPEADVQMSGNAQTGDQHAGMMLVLSTKTPREDVVKFYQDKLKEMNWKVAAGLETNGVTIMGGTKDRRFVSVQIATAGEHTQITLSVGGGME